ncbi:MAG: prepilin-type N-terminal cleavage/methylation domain-containing protein [Nitrospira sp.]
MGNETVRVIRKRPSCATSSSQSALTQTQGFTLIELMLAVSIVGVLASLAAPNYLDFVEKARVAKTVAELHGLTKEIKGYALGFEQYPDSLADIGRSTMLDAWGTPYQYYKINCGTIMDIGSLARLKLRKQDSPRVILAADSPFTHSNGQISFAIDNGGHQHLLHFVQGAGGGNGGGGGPPCGGVGGARKDRFLVPINSDFDIYSMGKDKDTVAPLNPPKSHDDIIRASDGGFYGLAKNF